ncbi:START-like domain [Phytophthora cactorum]|nr:START-like domain [Phytophthora cactorum]
MMFPLPLDFFPPLRLSNQEAQSFLQWGDSLLQQTIDAYHREQFDTQETRERKWKPIKQKHDLTVYRRRKIKDDSDFKYLCTGRIDGTLDEVVMGRYADNTPDFRRISGVYREDIVDCAVLGVIKKRSPEDPFFLSCFKWMTVESPGKGLVKNRDVCWYEQVGMTRDRNGKEIGYTLTESVELPTCPLFNECVRAKFSICYLYKRNKSGGVKVYMRGKNDAGGKVVDWAMSVAHAVIATALVEAGKHTVRPFITHGKCEVCHAKASGFLSSSKQCAVCHRLTCSSCVSKVRVLSFHDFRVPHNEQFCKKCMRLIHQVDLRAPESVRNLVEYAAASLTGSESSQDSFMSSTRGRAATDDSGEGENQHAASASSSHSSSGGSFRTLPQPIIGVNRQDQEEDETYNAQSGGPAPLPKHPGQPTHSTQMKLKISRSKDAYAGKRTTVKRRHSHSPPSSPEDNYYKGRDSETPVTRGSMAVARLNSASSRPYNGSFNSPRAYERNDSDPDSLMAQIIQMNLIAEQSRQQIQDNIKMARQLSSSRS